MDEEDSQDELINKNITCGKGKRPSASILSDEGINILFFKDSDCSGPLFREGPYLKYEMLGCLNLLKSYP